MMADDTDQSPPPEIIPADANTPVGNQNTGDLRDKVNRAQGLREENVAPVAPASGTFYQRKVPAAEEPANG